MRVKKILRVIADPEIRVAIALALLAITVIEPEAKAIELPIL